MTPTIAVGAPPAIATTLPVWRVLNCYILTEESRHPDYVAASRVVHRRVAHVTLVMSEPAGGGRVSHSRLRAIAQTALAGPRSEVKRLDDGTYPLPVFSIVYRTIKDRLPSIPIEAK